MIKDKNIVGILNENLQYLNKRKYALTNELNNENNYSKKDDIEMFLDMVNEGIAFMENNIKNYKDENVLERDFIWFHRTSVDAFDSINEKGFVLPKKSSRFGKGIYFMNNPENICFGDKILNCKFDGRILSLWHEEIRNIFKEYNLQPEEEGIELLEGYTKNLNYDAVEVKYLDGTSELVVYNISKIKIIN